MASPPSSAALPQAVPRVGVVLELSPDQWKLADRRLTLQVSRVRDDIIPRWGKDWLLIDGHEVIPGGQQAGQYMQILMRRDAIPPEARDNGQAIPCGSPRSELPSATDTLADLDMLLRGSRCVHSNSGPG